MILNVIKKGDVVTLKLTSGEELIARYSHDDNTQFVLCKPLVVAMTKTGPGLMPYLFTVSPDTDVPILKTAIAVIVKTDKEFADQYLSSTSSIQL